MMYIIYYSMMSMTLMFLSASHPLSIGLILLIQVTIIAMLTGTMAYNFFFSYILFIVMIGGMLVLFIYMTSVASNESFSYSYMMTLIAFMMVMTTMVSMFLDPLNNFISVYSTDMLEFNLSIKFTESLWKFYHFPTNTIMMMLIIYLLITLIAAVKITNISYGPLRQKF